VQKKRLLVRIITYCPSPAYLHHLSLSVQARSSHSAETSTIHTACSLAIAEEPAVSTRGQHGPVIAFPRGRAAGSWARVPGPARRVPWGPDAAPPPPWVGALGPGAGAGVSGTPCTPPWSSDVHTHSHPRGPPLPGRDGSCLFPRRPSTRAGAGLQCCPQPGRLLSPTATLSSRSRGDSEKDP
jgi:hypothetical protein